eukprot:114018_1
MTGHLPSLVCAFDVGGITADEFQEHADLRALLSDLAARTPLDEHGNSAEQSRQLKQSECDLLVAKSRWLKSSILLEELKSTLADGLKDVENTDPGNVQTFREAERILSASETILTIRSRSGLSKDRSILGVDEKTIRKVFLDAPNISERIERIKECLLPDIENRILKKWAHLCQQYTSMAASSDVPSMAHSMSTWMVADFASAKANETERNRSALKVAERKSERQFLALYQTMKTNIELLASFINTRVLDADMMSDKVHAGWLNHKCHALILKLRYMKWQLIRETYTAEKVSALEVIRKTLENSHREAVNEYRQLKSKIREFDSLGLGFKDIVDDYSDLMSKIHDKSVFLRQIENNG